MRKLLYIDHMNVMMKQIFSACIVIMFSCSVLWGQLRSGSLKGNDKKQYDNFAILVEKYQKEGNKIQEANYLNKIAYLFWENGATKEAVDFFLQSVELNKQVGNQNGVQGIYTHIGSIYFDEAMYSQALEYFKKSLAINKKMGRSRKMLLDYINMSSTFSEMENYQESISYAQEGLKLAKEINDMKYIKTCYGILYENYEKIGDTEKSFEYFNIYSSLDKKMQKDKMSEMEDKTKQVEAEKRKKEMELRQTVDTLKEVTELAQIRQIQIDNLNKEQQIKELKIQKQEAKQKTYKLVIVSFIGGIFLLALILFILLRNYKQKQRTNALLENQNKEILEQRDIIETANRNLTNSINYAKRIQQAMLPPIENLKTYLPESFILFKPRDIVSGDFYWFSETSLKSAISKSKGEIIEGMGIKEGLDYNKLIIAAVDCTGHGVPGAFMSMIGYNLMHEIISMGITEPEKILGVLHEGIRNQLKQNETDNRDGMDMAVCAIHRKENIIEFAGAKNPLVYVMDNEIHQIRGDFVPIGGFQCEKEKRRYTKHTVEFNKPVTCYIFSDGYSDQIGGKTGKKFLSKRFRELLFEIHKLPMEEQKEILDKKLLEWQGTEYNQVDDILVIGFQVHPANNTK